MVSLLLTNRLFVYLGFSALFLVLVIHLTRTDYIDTVRESFLIYKSRLYLSSSKEDKDSSGLDQKKLKEEIVEKLNWTRLEQPSGTLNGDEIFVFYAFYDTRDSLGPRIRLAANVVCKEINTTIPQISVHVGETTVLLLEWAEQLGDENWACNGAYGLQEMALATSVYHGPVPDEISIVRNTSKVKVRLHKIPVEYEDHINACIINALFWYNDWPSLFLILEKWRANRVRKVLIHVHSMSTTVKRVLDYYEKQGLVELRPFPRMPFTKEYDPNNRMYYGAEQLITFMCSVWSNTKYTAMNDIDEMLQIRRPNESLLEMVRRVMDPEKGEKLAYGYMQNTALAFHNGLAPDPWSIEELAKFQFLKEPILYTDVVAGKYIMKTRYARRPWIHNMGSFFGNQTRGWLSSDDVLFVHMGNKLKNVPNATNYPEARIFEDDHFAKLAPVLKEIFNGDSPPYRTRVTKPALNHCMQQSISDQPGEVFSKPTGTTCFNEMKDLDDWLSALPTDHVHYTFV